MIKFNEVTWYSKLAAAIFFILVLPALAFYIGSQYEKMKTMDLKIDDMKEVEHNEIQSLMIGILTEAGIQNPDLRKVSPEGDNTPGGYIFENTEANGNTISNKINEELRKRDFIWVNGGDGGPNSSSEYVKGYVRCQIISSGMFEPDSVKIDTPTPYQQSFICKIDTDYYENIQHGFSLSFPSSWNNSRIVEDDTGVVFGLEDQDVVFSILVMTKQEYDECKEGALCSVELLKQQGDSYYVVSYGQDYTDLVHPYIKDGQLAMILSTFKLVR